jgi:hypothetical protein
MSRAAAARTDPVSATAVYARSRPVVVTSTAKTPKETLDCYAYYLMDIAYFGQAPWLYYYGQEDAL